MKSQFSRILAVAGAGLVGVFGVVAPAAAQVAYRPYRPVAPTPYGYPVPYGYLQPDEVLGTSPSFVINPTGYGPVVSVVRRCQYPNGWNETDFVRDVNGIPAGIDHTCPPDGPGAAR